MQQRVWIKIQAIKHISNHQKTWQMIWIRRKHMSNTVAGSIYGNIYKCTKVNMMPESGTSKIQKPSYQKLPLTLSLYSCPLLRQASKTLGVRSWRRCRSVLGRRSHVTKSNHHWIWLCGGLLNGLGRWGCDGSYNTWDGLSGYCCSCKNRCNWELAELLVLKYGQVSKLQSARHPSVLKLIVME